MKTINVVAALIVHDGKIFATQRGYGDWRGWWELPGGNEEAGESSEKALVREIREELATEISVDRYVTTVGSGTTLPSTSACAAICAAWYRAR